MKKALGFVALASMAVLLMAAARGASGTSVFKLRADQTTANTKIAEFDNGVGIGSLDRAQLVPRKEFEAQQKAAG